MNILNSSSFHTLNADKPLSSREQKWWFTLNRINNNCFPNVIDQQLDVTTFQCSISENDWSHLLPKSSPSRIFSDLFWLKLPWQSIQQELGEIHIFDIGCGKGGYSAKLQDLWWIPLFGQ